MWKRIKRFGFMCAPLTLNDTAIISGGKIYWLFIGNSTVWSYFSYCYKRISITKQLRVGIITIVYN